MCTRREHEQQNEKARKGGRGEGKPKQRGLDKLYRKKDRHTQREREREREREMPVKNFFCRPGGVQHPAISKDVESGKGPQDEKKNKRLSDRVKAALVKQESERLALSSIREEPNYQRRFDQAIERVSLAIVVINTLYTRAVDGTVGSSTATGFVVDAKKGILLTNRHVCGVGPVRATATFQNKEEVNLELLYADPVHDFGFFKYNPKKVKFLEPGEIKLAPEKAKVGLEIKVIGNDNGEELQILGGTLARLDRNAPQYGGTYSDFNTFYYSAASSTSGGSSGSPVVDVDGDAVALNAGGATNAASSFFLPLDRVVRALKSIRKKKFPERRTVQAMFAHMPFTEIERLGLPDKTQEEIRSKHPEALGMLCVQLTAPEGPADKAGMQIGDIVVRMNGELIHDFGRFQEITDDSDKIDFILSRGGEEMKMSVRTDDLHKLMPTEFLEVAQGILIPLSLHMSFLTQLPCGQVIVIKSGNMFRGFDLAVIAELGGKRTPDLQSLVDALCEQPREALIPAKIVSPSNRFTEIAVTVPIERHWFEWRSAQKTVSSDGVITWEYTDLPQSPGPKLMEKKRVVKFRSNLHAQLVIITFKSPQPMDGNSNVSYKGTGIVLDAKNGIVVCDRQTVPNTLGHIEVYLGNSFKVSAKCVFVHPQHNYSFIQLDTEKYEIDAAPEVTSLEAQLSESRLQEGDMCLFAGYSPQESVFLKQTRITLEGRFASLGSDSPRFVDMNQTIMTTDQNDPNLGGVMLDAQGKILAFHFAFYISGHESQYAIHASEVFDVYSKFKKEMLRGGATVSTLAVKLGVVHMAEASAAMNLSEEWVERMHETQPGMNHVFIIRQVLAKSKSEGVLIPGDILLAIDDMPVTNYTVMDDAVSGKTTVKVKVLRDQKEMEEKVQVSGMSSVGTDRIVLWSGLTLQAPHYAVKWHGHLPKQALGEGEQKGIYITHGVAGTPAQMYGIPTGLFITSINEKPVRTLDAFLEAVEVVPDTEFLRVGLITLSGTPLVVTLKQDRYYWPTKNATRDPKTAEWSIDVVDRRKN